MTIAISLAALAVSLSALVATRWRDRRDLLLRLHDRLTTADQQRGRRLLYVMSESGMRVEDLNDDQYELVNNALAFLNTLGIYYQRRYVRRKDLLEVWSEPVLRIIGPAEPFLAHRDALPGGRVWPHLHVLTDAAREHARRQGMDPAVIEAIRNRPSAP